MAPENGHDDGGAMQKTVFIDTTLDTHLATIVSDSDTVSDLKKKIMLEHRQCFPATGEIEIHCLKVKRRGNFYHLSDSMLVKSAFDSTKKNWFLSVDASRIEQSNGLPHMNKTKVGNQLALPWLNDSRSIDQHDIASPSMMHPKIVPFVSQKVPNIEQFTSGDSNKNFQKSMEEDRSSNDNQYRKLDARVDEKLSTVNDKEIKSKKRIRDVNNEGSPEVNLGSGLLVKKKRKTGKTVNNVKAAEEDKVITSVNDENSVEDKSKGKDVILDDVVIKGVSDEKNTETSEIVPDVVMVVEKNILEEMPIEMSQKEKGNELVQEMDVGNEIASSVMRTSDHGRDPPVVLAISNKKGARRSTRSKAAKKEAPSTPFIEKLVNTNKEEIINSSKQDLESRNQEITDDQIDNHKEDEVKLPETTTAIKRRKTRKSAAKNKNESQVKNADNSSTVHVPVFDEKIVDEEKNDKDNLISVAKNEVIEKALVDDSIVCMSKKDDDLIAKEVEILEPITVHVENVAEKSKKEVKGTAGSRRKKKDVEKVSRNDESVVKNANDDLQVDNIVDNNLEISKIEEKRSEVNEESIKDDSKKDDIVDNNSEISKIEEKRSEVNEEGIKDNSEKDDGKKKRKRKKKIKKVSATNDAENSKEGEKSKIIEQINNEVENLKEGEKSNNIEQINNEVENSKEGENSKIIEQINNEVENLKEGEKNQLIEQVNSEVDTPKEKSHEIDFKEYFSPSQQSNKIPTISEKKQNKKTKERQLPSESENNKVLSFSKQIPEASTDMVKEKIIPNADHLKTPKLTKKIDPPKTSKSVLASSNSSFDESVLSRKIKKPQLIIGQTPHVVKTVKKSAPVVKSSLHKPATIFGDDSDESSADDNANVNSDSSTRTPSRNSSSSGESDSSIDSRRHGGSRVIKRKDSGGGKNNINSQLRNASISDLLRSSSRFKKAKFSASQKMDDSESQPVDFVPESQLVD